MGQIFTFHLTRVRLLMSKFDSGALNINWQEKPKFTSETLVADNHLGREEQNPIPAPAD